jgi:hypothetical protein
MFHVKPAAPALLLGFLLSGAAFAQADAGVASDAGTEAPARPAKRKAPATTQKKTGGAGTKKAATGTKKSTASKPASKRDPRTVGLGRSCGKRADCSSKSQVCLRQQDQRGKTLARGFCALPCARLDQGLTPTRPGFPARDPQTTEKILRKPPPPRCPARFKCRSRSADIPIDLCVRE